MIEGAEEAEKKTCRKSYSQRGNDSKLSLYSPEGFSLPAQ